MTLPKKIRFDVLFMFEIRALQISEDQDSRNIQPGGKQFEIQPGVDQNAREIKAN
jgi:hypothetical protein